MADDPDLSAIVHDQIEAVLAGLESPIEQRDRPYVTATPPAPCAAGLLNIRLEQSGIVRSYTIQVGPEWKSASLVMRWDNSYAPPLRAAHLVGLGAEGHPVEVVDLWRAE